MTNEQLILQYDQEFWALVEDKSYTFRKARRVLKKKYPGICYDSQRDKWVVYNHTCRVEVSK